MYLAIIKACKMRGQAGEHVLRFCAAQLICVLIGLAEDVFKAEAMLREALLVLLSSLSQM